MSVIALHSGGDNVNYGFDNAYLVALERDGEKTVRKPALPNLFDDGRCCTGDIPEGSHGHALQLAHTVRQAWLNNTWNMDLPPSGGMRDKWLRFDGKTGLNILPESQEDWKADWTPISWSGLIAEALRLLVEHYDEVKLLKQRRM